jgi:hypothetical protein
MSKRSARLSSVPLKRDSKILGALTIYADDLGKFNELLQEWSDLFALKVMTLRSREQHDGSDTVPKELELKQAESHLRLVMGHDSRADSQRSARRLP